MLYQHPAHEELIFVDGLLHRQCLVDIVIRKLSGLIGDDTVGRAAQQQIDRIGAHGRSIYPVLRRRTAAPLNIAEDRRPCLNAGRRLEPLGQTVGFADAFRIDDNMMGLALLTVVQDRLDEILLIKFFLLRNQNTVRAVGDVAPECDVAVLQRSWEVEVS